MKITIGMLLYLLSLDTAIYTNNIMPAPESRFFPGLALCFHR